MRKAETRAALLAAAADLFAKRGIAVTSIDDVAASVGLTKGAVYAHFAGKSDLVRAIFDSFDSANALDQHRALLFDETKTLEERLRSLGRSFARLVRTAPVEVVYLDAEHFLYVARDGDSTAARRDEREMFRKLGAELERVARRRGERLPMSGVRFVTLVQTLARGLLYQWARDPASMPGALIEDAFASLASASASRAAARSSTRRRPPRGATTTR